MGGLKEKVDQYTWEKYVSRVFNLSTSIVIVPIMDRNLINESISKFSPIICNDKHSRINGSYGSMCFNR